MNFCDNIYNSIVETDNYPSLRRLLARQPHTDYGRVSTNLTIGGYL
jgi:hypothetical protein